MFINNQFIMYLYTKIFLDIRYCRFIEKVWTPLSAFQADPKSRKKSFELKQLLFLTGLPLSLCLSLGVIALVNWFIPGWATGASAECKCQLRKQFVSTATTILPSEKVQQLWS